MRYIYLIILFIYSVVSFGQGVSRQTELAYALVRDGYILCGVEEMGKSAATNDLAAQYFMGKCYEFGLGVEKNIVEAFRFYRKAAERGLPDAMYRMADFYRDGDVVSPNENRRKEWQDRFWKKGGKCFFPDIVSAYNEGLKRPENYAVNPNTQGSLAANDTEGGAVNVTNHITIVQQIPQSVQGITSTSSLSNANVRKSDIDTSIPMNPQGNDNTFALVFANEDYQNVARVPNAQNDGRVFAEYCEKALGIPKSNIHCIVNATFNNMKRELNLMKQIAEAYKGEGKFIVYYAGHGVPDESTKNAYLLPTDGYCSDMTTCFSLNELYRILGGMPSQQIVLFLDACFSGSLRGDGMLASARGVAIKSKAESLHGKVVVVSASQGDETAYSYQEQGHGMFTYFLLKHLKESRGEATLGDLFYCIRDNVVKKSLVVNGKSQTPTFSVSPSLGDSWKTWKLK